VLHTKLRNRTFQGPDRQGQGQGPGQGLNLQGQGQGLNITGVSSSSLKSLMILIYLPTTRN